MVSFTSRPARSPDVAAIRQLVAPYVDTRRLIAKDAVTYYESVQQFRVVESPTGGLLGCGALHVMWDDLAEVRTVAVDPAYGGRGVGSVILRDLIDDARALGVRRIFCLTFETTFFGKHGFEPIDGQTVDPQVYAELVRSYDEGIAEFLGLERVKPNTLGNTRMLLTLS